MFKLAKKKVVGVSENRTRDFRDSKSKKKKLMPRLRFELEILGTLIAKNKI